MLVACFWFRDISENNMRGPTYPAGFCGCSICSAQRPQCRRQLEISPHIPCLQRLLFDRSEPLEFFYPVQLLLSARYASAMLIWTDMISLIAALQPIFVHLSKDNHGNFAFHPVSVNFLTEVVKCTFAVGTLLYLVCYSRIPSASLKKAQLQAHNPSEISNSADIFA